LIALCAGLATYVIGKVKVAGITKRRFTMSEIVTGTVTGIVDTSGITRDIADARRETALEAGDVRRDIQAESHRVSEEASRDASNFYIAETAAQTQTAKEIARSQAWTEAKIDAGFVKVAGDTALASQIVQGSIALQGEVTRGAMALQHGVLTLQIANEANATRALIQANLIDDLRAKSEERNNVIIEMRGDHRHLERECGNLRHSMQANQFASLQTQLQMMGSDLQAARQGVVNLGTMTGTTQTANPTVVR
jgi:hypothetical protein